MPTFRCKTYGGQGTPSGWQTIAGEDIRDALESAARALPVDGDPVLVHVEDNGNWWIQAESRVVYSARPVLDTPMECPK